ALVQSPILTVSHKKFRRKQVAASELPQAHNDVFKRNTTNEANCLLCTTKSADFDANCSRCGCGCHRLDTCSVLLPGSDGEHTDKRMCNKCVGLFPSKGVFDLWAFENWGGRGVLNKKEKGYYGRACPELRPRLESNSLSVKLKLLRNGGDSNLQPRKLGGLKISLNNTCAVDSIIHLLMIAYCDSDGFREIADTSNSKILQLAVHLVKKGPNAEAYRLRAEALYENLSDACKPVAFGLMGIDCARTPEELLKKLGLPPSVRDHISCSSQYCPAQGRIQDVSYIAVGYDEIQGNVVNLQDTLDHNKVMDSSVCMQPFKETDGVPLTPDVAIQDQEISKNVLCSGINTHNPVSQDIVFLSVAGQHSLVHSKGTEQYVYECQIEECLSAVPATLIIFGKVFFLRGVIAFIPPGNLITRSSKSLGIGHYVAYGRRVGGQWFCLDDLRDTPKAVNANTKVKLDMLFYTKF
ncbi:120.7 kDa protein in NOF-FB transposable element, partial [Frankliniella fusca]